MSSIVFSWDIQTEMFAEGFRDKIFDTETVAALRRALLVAYNKASVRSEAVKFFIAAIAQGVHHCLVGYSYQNVCRGLSGQDI